MRLKKITIFGFKSFADRTTLEFDFGITGIVGPNGCGKSNIADAFRWVLGEQSAKSMRGQKMPDVIFSGTSIRKPLNFAEVTITLGDIQEGELPVAYSELAVTRRLHRSGESEYFINRQPVRLKDIHEILLHSGMGKDAFSIFEQGKVEQVIMASPYDRRAIFEEAAEILRFLQRKKEALRKLDLSQQNVSRIKDIHLEVEKQIVILEAQAEKARLYKENKAHIEQLEKAIVVAKWDVLYKRCQEAFKKETDFKLRSQEIREKHQITLSELESTKRQMGECEQQLKRCNENVYRAKSEKEIKIREKLAQQERVKELLVKEKRWRDDVEAVLEKREMLKQEQKNIFERQKEIQEDLQQSTEDTNLQKEKVRALDLELSELREKQSRAQQALLLLLQSESQIESEIKQNTVRIEHHRERKEQLSDRRNKLEELYKELLRQVSEKSELVQEATQQLENQKQRHQHLEMEIEELTQLMQASQKQQETLQIDWTESKAREKALLRLREEMEGFSAGSKRLLQETSNPRSVLYQKIKGLYEYISAQEGVEIPVSTAMKPYSQTLVVETERDYRDVIAFAQEQGLKDFSLLCLDFLCPLEASTRWNETTIPLLNSNDMNRPSQHFLKNAAAAKTLEDAIDWVKQADYGCAWTENGIFVDSRQVIFHVSKGENNVFLRESELKGLEKKITDIESQKHVVEGFLKDSQQRRFQLQEEKKGLDQTIRKGEMKFMEVNFSLQRVRADLEKAQLEKGQIDQETKNLQGIIENLIGLLAELKQHHADAQSKAMREKELNTLLSQDLEKQVQVLKGEQSILQQKESILRKQSEEFSKIGHALHVLEVKILDAQEQEKRLREELEQSRESIENLKDKESDFELGMEEIEEKLESALLAQTEKEQEVSLWKTKIESFDQILEQERILLKTVEQEMQQILIQLAQIESGRQAIEEEVRDRHQSSIEVIKEQGHILETSLDKAEKELKALRHVMENAGDVNMTSIEEYERCKTRYDFLKEQIDDMNHSKEELLEMIAQLEAESRKMFKETFESIRVNFQKNFQILFNGGEADLQFTDDQDVLEAGIEIVAKPPGKQMRSIHLMSGGEKCLTAMALLFAIFEVKPAPFCILDEIDAPLDDSNVERFANVLKQFIDRCQFIIITHNKRTMSIADVLFGVSMEEKGVSKMLSLTFSTAENLVAVN